MTAHKSSFLPVFVCTAQKSTPIPSTLTSPLNANTAQAATGRASKTSHDAAKEGGGEEGEGEGEGEGGGGGGEEWKEESNKESPDIQQPNT